MPPHHRLALRTRAASCAPLRPTLEFYHTARAVVHHSKFRWLMSALGQKRTFRWVKTMSALPLKADIVLQQDRDVSFVPISSLQPMENAKWSISRCDAVVVICVASP